MKQGSRKVKQNNGFRKDNPGSRIQGVHPQGVHTQESQSAGSLSSGLLFGEVSYPGGVPYLDLSIFRESWVKSLIKKNSKDMYLLLKDVRFDGRYYRVKCVNSNGWECCWDLAVRIEFFGKMQGITLYPKRTVLKGEKRIVYKALILVNPYELWEEKLVSKFWGLQERLEFLIARILFHECIHVMISLGKTFPGGFGDTDIFLEFREVLNAANSDELAFERREVQFRLWNLVVFGSSDRDDEEEMLMRVLEIYEFLLNEKYSTQKSGKVFGDPWGNKRVSAKYSWMAGVKAGGSRQVEKKVWETEVRRLRRALKELYDGVDRKVKA